MMRSHHNLEIVLIILVKWIQFRGRARRNLDELYAGVCDGLTYQEIKEKFPEEFARRQEDKLTYRYPRGEFQIMTFVYPADDY
jgi:broad specificity phosphatase PhoE